MTYQAYTDGINLRLLLQPELEDLTGWTQVTLPEDYAPDLYRIVDGELVLDLTQRKERVWGNIKTIRESKLLVAPTSFGLFDVDETGKSNILGMLQAIDYLDTAVEEPIVWKMHDNSFVSFTREEFKTAALEALAYIRTTYSTSFLVESQIESATSTEELESIQWPEE